MGRTSGPHILRRDERIKRLCEDVDRYREAICITGSHGSGKTQTLCEMYRHFEEMRFTHVVGFFPEAVKASMSLNSIFDYLLASTRLALGLSPVIDCSNEDSGDSLPTPAEWAEMFNRSFKEFSKRSKQVHRLVVIVDSSDGHDGLLEMANKVFSSVDPYSNREKSKNKSVFFKVVLSEDAERCESTEGSFLETPTDQLDDEEFVSLVEMKLDKNHRDVTREMHDALVNLNAEKSPLYAALVARRLSLIEGGELLPLKDSSEINAYISQMISELPNTVFGLASSLLREIADVVDPMLSMTIFRILAFLPFGATKSTLRAILSKLDVLWSDLEFEDILTYCSPIIRRAQDGLISIDLPELREQIVEEVRSRDKEYARRFSQLIINRLLATCDISSACFSNIFIPCRENDMPNLPLALCDLAVQCQDVVYIRWVTNRDGSRML